MSWDLQNVSRSTAERIKTFLWSQNSLARNRYMSIFFWREPSQNDYISLVNQNIINNDKVISIRYVTHLMIYLIYIIRNIRNTYNSRWLRSGRCDRCIAKTRGNVFARTRTAASTDRMGNGIKCRGSYRILDASKITVWFGFFCPLMPYFWLWWQRNYRSPICWCRWTWVLICTFIVADGCYVSIIYLCNV